MRAAIILTALLLAGCAAAPTPPPAPPPRQAAPISLNGVCSQVKVFSQAEADALADAAAKLDASSIMVVVMQDYGRMRAEARACAKAAG